MNKERPIFLIDDHQVLTDGLKLIISSAEFANIHCINQVTSISDISRITAGGIVVLDININGIYGIDILIEIQQKYPETDVIILSSYKDAFMIKAAMENGCKGFLSKQLASDHILLALSSISQGKHYYDPQIQEIINVVFAGKDSSLLHDQERKLLPMLTKREIQILKLIATGFSSIQISKSLYISKGTVDSHRKKLIQKLQVKNSVELGVIAKENHLI